MEYAILREFVDDEMLQIARKQIPQGKTKDYYQGLSDAFAHCVKMQGTLNKREQTELISAILVELKDLT